MILKRQFNPTRILPYVWREMLCTVLLSCLIWQAWIQGQTWVALPMAPLGILGTALAIFLAFRNNTAYARWWEARQLWAQITSSSRVFARLLVTFTDAHRHTPAYVSERAEAFKREGVQRQIAWVHALRLQLREQQDWQSLSPWLSPAELETLPQRSNPANYLLRRQAERIYEAMADGTLQGFDSFQLEGCLLQLATAQSSCERIKTTPLPRQYDFFTRLFVWVFLTLLPFSLISLIAKETQPVMLIPFATLLAFVFAVIQKTGEVTEDPFENRIQDVPMTAICRTIERDLLETLGETDLPPVLEAVNGYLY